MQKRISIPGFLALFLFLTTATLHGQSASIVTGKPTIAQVPSPLSLDLRPGLDLPLGDSSQWFSMGGAIDLGLSYRIPQSLFYLSGGLTYSYAPVQADTSVSLAAARVGGGVQVPLTGAIAVLAYAMGGYYVGAYNDFSDSVTDPFLGAGVGLKFALAPTFALQVGAQYKYYAGLYQSLSAGAGIDVSLGNLGGSIEVPSVELRPAFPVFYKHYDDHPIGTVQVKSNLRVPASNIRAQVLIKEYMDSPKVVEVPGVLAPGESRVIELYALFTEKVLSVTEGTKVAAEITMSYTIDGQSYVDRKIETLTIWGRNAMTWDDNRKAAAYVTAKDPAVLNFARSVISYVHSKENRSICDNLQAAVALHAALELYGLNYTPSPVTPYAEISKQKEAIDFLQFPRETFQYKAGDCSDISILYAALFQAVGIDAAFVTIPGHIFIAVDTCVPPERAPRELIRAGQFIPYKKKAWIPIEITAIHGGFLKAWQLGAKEWNENNSLGLAGFYPVQEAWSAYQPVGLPGTEITVAAPQSDRILSAYQAEIQKCIDAAIVPQVAMLQEQIQTTESISAMNSLGVLYAKYGQMDNAEKQFKQVLQKQQYLPALLNLGHLYYIKGDWKNALASYSLAREMDPRDARTVLAIARVNHELQNYADAKRSYELLRALDPALADQFAYLGEGKETGARAADVESERTAIIWESDQLE